jgi:hypothetical protein
VGYTRKQEKKEWFDEKRATVNVEKNCVKARRVIQIQNRTRAAKQANTTKENAPV